MHVAGYKQTVTNITKYTVTVYIYIFICNTLQYALVDINTVDQIADW